MGDIRSQLAERAAILNSTLPSSSTLERNKTASAQNADNSPYSPYSQHNQHTQHPQYPRYPQTPSSSPSYPSSNAQEDEGREEGQAGGDTEGQEGEDSGRKRAKKKRGEGKQRGFRLFGSRSTPPSSANPTGAPSDEEETGLHSSSSFSVYSSYSPFLSGSSGTPASDNTTSAYSNKAAGVTHSITFRGFNPDGTPIENEPEEEKKKGWRFRKKKRVKAEQDKSGEEAEKVEETQSSASGTGDEKQQFEEIKSEGKKERKRKKEKREKTRHLGRNRQGSNTDAQASVAEMLGVELSAEEAIELNNRLERDEMDEADRQRRRDKKKRAARTFGNIVFIALSVYIIFLIFGAYVTDYIYDDHGYVVPQVLDYTEVKALDEFKQVLNQYDVSKSLYEEILMLDYRLGTGQEDARVLATEYEALLETVNKILVQFDATTFPVRYQQVAETIRTWIDMDAAQYLQNISAAITQNNSGAADLALSNRSSMRTDFANMTQNMVSIGNNIKGIFMDAYAQWDPDEYILQRVGNVDTLTDG